MTISKLLILVGMNLRASSKRALLYFTMLAITLMFLFAITICYERIVISVDSNLNEAADLTSYRTFFFTGTTEKLKEYPEIGTIEIVDEETSEYKIIVVDYRTIFKTIQKIEKQQIGTVTVNGDTLMEIEAFFKIKRIIQICLILMLAGTFGTLYLLIHKRFQDRYYEISLYKAVGYDCTQILQLIWIELLLLILFSSTAAFAGGYAIYYFFETKTMGLMTQSLFTHGQQGNLACKMGLVAFLVVLLALVSSFKIWNEIHKIDVRVLRAR